MRLSNNAYHKEFSASLDTSLHTSQLDYSLPPLMSYNYEEAGVP